MAGARAGGRPAPCPSSALPGPGPRGQDAPVAAARPRRSTRSGGGPRPRRALGAMRPLHASPARRFACPRRLHLRGLSPLPRARPRSADRPPSGRDYEDHRAGSCGPSFGSGQPVRDGLDPGAPCSPRGPSTTSPSWRACSPPPSGAVRALSLRAERADGRPGQARGGARVAGGRQPRAALSELRRGSPHSGAVLWRRIVRARRHGCLHELLRHTSAAGSASIHSVFRGSTRRGSNPEPASASRRRHQPACGECQGTAEFAQQPVKHNPDGLPLHQNPRSASRPRRR